MDRHDRHSVHVFKLVSFFANWIIYVEILPKWKYPVWRWNPVKSCVQPPPRYYITTMGFGAF